MIANSPIDLQEIFKADWDSIGLPLNKYPWKSPKPSPVPPISRPSLDTHQNWVSDFASLDFPAESIHKIHGEEQFWNKPNPPIPPLEPDQTLSEYDKKKIDFYDDLNNFFHGSIPGDLKQQWESLSKWPPKFPGETPDSAYIKYSEPKETHTDYDTIKNTLTTWTDLFGTETPQQIKNKLDAKPAGHELTEDEKEAIKLYPATKAERDGWIDAFPYKKPSEIKKALTESESKFSALEKETNLLWEYDNDLTNIIKKAISAQGKISPSENIIETPLRQVVHKLDSYSKLLGLNKEKVEKIEGSDGEWLILVEVEKPKTDTAEEIKPGIESEKLWNTIGFIVKESKQGSLVLASFIKSKGQAREIIKIKLEEVQEEWRYYLESTDKQIFYKHPLLGLAWKDEKRRESGKEILKWIIDARIGNITYEELVIRWNHKQQHEDFYDYDGSLFTLNLLLGIEDNPSLTTSNPTKQLIIQALEQYLSPDRIKEKLGDIHEGWLSS